MADALSALLMVSTGLIALALYGNFRRRAFTEPTELVPNCLMTKAPLEFWTGARSLFYFMSYWNDIPTYMRAHGYEVRQVALPWRDPIARRAFAAEKLMRGAGHVVIDSVMSEEFSDLLKQHPPRSLTVISAAHQATGFNRICFSLHRLVLRWTTSTLPSPSAGALGLDRRQSERVKRTLLEEIRLKAESDWDDSQFPLEAAVTS